MRFGNQHRTESYVIISSTTQTWDDLRITTWWSTTFKRFSRWLSLDRLNTTVWYHHPSGLPWTLNISWLSHENNTSRTGDVSNSSTPLIRFLNLWCRFGIWVSHHLQNSRIRLWKDSIMNDHYQGISFLCWQFDKVPHVWLFWQVVRRFDMRIISAKQAIFWLSQFMLPTDVTLRSWQYLNIDSFKN